jgi:site-specific DNA recombinase
LPLTTAAIYTRISSDQGREGIGVAAQEEICRELAASHGLEVVATFSDNDVGASEKTASTKVRTDYNRMLEEARAGKFRFILAYSASRLTRRLDELDDFVRLAQPPYGVRVLTKVSGDDDLTTADGLMMARFKAVIDAGESHRISERAKARHLSNAQQGKLKRSPWRAFGFEDDGITHRETEAVLIREAVTLIKSGAGLSEIGRIWEQRGVKGTPVWKKGLAPGERYQRTEWNHSDVRDVVFRWKNVGIRDRYGKPVVVDGEYVKGAWEPIYSLEDRELALAEIETHYHKPKRSTTKRVLSGLLECGKCSRKMYGRDDSSRGQPTYICTDGRKAHLGITATALEQYVQDVVFRYIMERTYYGELEAAAEPKAWSGEERLKTVTRKMEELANAYSEDEIDSTTYFPMIKRFRSEQADLIAQRTQHLASQRPKERVIKDADEALNFLRNWRHEPIERRRAALRDELHGIVIAPGEQGKRGHQTLVRRVKFGWKEPHPTFNGRSAEEAVNEPLMSFLRQEHAKAEGHPAPPPRSDREAYEEWLESTMPSSDDLTVL